MVNFKSTKANCRKMKHKNYRNMSTKKLLSTLDKAEHNFEFISQNKLEQIGKMQNLSQNDLDQIKKMLNLS